jgi:predicted ATPase with chaperone activity
MLGGDIYVPYAVDIDGQIMVVNDPVYHRPAHNVNRARAVVEGTPDWLAGATDHDLRFNHVRRPVVLTGGELTLPQLDLQYDHFTKMYQAPFQLKANGGILIIDDFGRQRVEPRDLLNRWIVPLDRRVDFLTLHTGSKFPVPFDCLLIFATNLDPKALVDEAFMRRIHYKVHVQSPNQQQFAEIFRRCCEQRSIPFEDHALMQVYGEYYGKLKIAPRSVHPRDILDHLVDIAKYSQIDATLSSDLIERACRSYFLDATL